MSDRVPPAERLEDDEGSRLRFVREHSRHWVNSMRATQAAFDAHSPDLRTIVRYEDLLEDTHGTLARLYQWLGADRTDAAVDSAVKANAFEAAPKEARGVGKARRAATPGLWRYNLSEREQEAIHEIMGEQLGMLGYEPERRIPTGLRTIAESR